MIFNTEFMKMWVCNTALPGEYAQDSTLGEPSCFLQPASQRNGPVQAAVKGDSTLLEHNVFWFTFGLMSID